VFPTSGHAGASFEEVAGLFEKAHIHQHGFLANGEYTLEFVLRRREGFLGLGAGVAQGLEFCGDGVGCGIFILQRDGKFLLRRLDRIGLGRRLSAAEVSAESAVGGDAQGGLGVEHALEAGLNDGPFVVGEGDLLANGVGRGRAAAKSAPAPETAAGLRHERHGGRQGHCRQSRFPTPTHVRSFLIQISRISLYG